MKDFIGYRAPSVKDRTAGKKANPKKVKANRLGIKWSPRAEDDK